MSRIAYVNGQYVPHNEAAVHVEDRGYQFADGVYEVICVAGGLTMLALAREFRAFSSLDAIAEHAQPSRPPLAAPQASGAQPAEEASTAGARR